MGSSTGSVYTAVSPGSYYCVISDEAGNFVCSEDAMVTTALFISVQPVSRNIYGRDAVNLTCVAGGGSGPENLYYNWYDAEGNLLGDESTYKADQEGEYYCRVGDFKTDEVVDSDLVQVYSQEIDLRPVITLQPESVQLEYREDGRYDWDMMCLALTFDGGSEDLKYQWQMYSKAFGFGLWRSIGEGQIIRRPDESGTFRCKVIDTRSGAYTYSDIATVDLGFTCIITGIESTNGYWFTMGYTIMGGNGPFTVKVYQHRYVGYNYTKGEANYMEVLMWTKTIQEAGHYRTPSVECAYSMCHQYSQNEEPSITIYHPDYYLFVEDASGHQFTTDLFEQYKANNT